MAALDFGGADVAFSLVQQLPELRRPEAERRERTGVF
jgi:hypothetical protein